MMSRSDRWWFDPTDDESKRSANWPCPMVASWPKTIQLNKNRVQLRPSRRSGSIFRQILNLKFRASFRSVKSTFRFRNPLPQTSTVATTLLWTNKVSVLLPHGFFKLKMGARLFSIARCAIETDIFAINTTAYVFQLECASRWFKLWKIGFQRFNYSFLNYRSTRRSRFRNKLWRYKPVFCRLRGKSRLINFPFKNNCIVCYNFFF